MKVIDWGELKSVADGDKVPETAAVLMADMKKKYTLRFFMTFPLADFLKNINNKIKKGIYKEEAPQVLSARLPAVEPGKVIYYLSGCFSMATPTNPYS
jgi:hypothetical protein